MRKEIIRPVSQEGQKTQQRWIDVENLARAEMSSEDPSFPIESALRLTSGPGWRAAQPGPQTIRLIFDTPIKLRQMRLAFREDEVARTQEFIIRWSPDDGRTFRDLVRQQYNFSPPGATTEQEEYKVDLDGVTLLEMAITPDVNRSDVRASLSQWLLA